MLSLRLDKYKCAYLLFITSSSLGKFKGRVVTDFCIHATLCRLVVTSELGEVAIFPFGQNSTSVLLKVTNLSILCTNIANCVENTLHVLRYIISLLIS
jgi:hypothetical protein